jgi:hypothetical protein
MSVTDRAAHAPRQPQAWLIFNVRQNMSDASTPSQKPGLKALPRWLEIVLLLVFAYAAAGSAYLVCVDYSFDKHLRIDFIFIMTLAIWSAWKSWRRIGGGRDKS